VGYLLRLRTVLDVGHEDRDDDGPVALAWKKEREEKEMCAKKSRDVVQVSARE
jgi:hypothetical protein